MKIPYVLGTNLIGPLWGLNELIDAQRLELCPARGEPQVSVSCPDDDDDAEERRRMQVRKMTTARRPMAVLFINCKGDKSVILVRYMAWCHKNASIEW